MPAEGTLWTVGHGTLPIEAFVDLLTGAGIRAIADIRAFPRSRRNPQFDRTPLAAALGAAGIDYEHERHLGGFRDPRPDSPNVALRKFRGYADHMSTPAFMDALERVLAASLARRTAVMCAESMPDACHRRYLADAAHARGWRVDHVLHGGDVRAHTVHPRARVVAGVVRYDRAVSSPQPSLFDP